MSGMSGNSMLGFKDLPEDSPRRGPLRLAAFVLGLVLVVFGVLSLLAGNGFTEQHGDTVLGLGTNGALGVLSVVVGLLVVAGVIIGGNTDAYVNTIAGIVFMAAGLASLAWMRTSFNYLAFDMWNVIFSFVVGMVLFAAGLYGRVSESRASASAPGARDRATRG
jgi:hypothetical protein